ncbi:MAG: hypothetical protein D6719_09565, partial [Candidatus Dadabacteria bacterium]
MRDRIRQLQGRHDKFLEIRYNQLPTEERHNWEDIIKRITGIENVEVVSNERAEKLKPVNEDKPPRGLAVYIPESESGPEKLLIKEALVADDNIPARNKNLAIVLA